MRPIDADALIEYKFKNDISYNAFKSLVQRQPTIDPVKHGMWTKHILKNANVPWGYDCSACDGWFVIGEDVIKKYHFCPNCGAMMDKEDGNGTV